MGPGIARSLQIPPGLTELALSGRPILPFTETRPSQVSLAATSQQQPTPYQLAPSSIRPGENPYHKAFHGAKTVVDLRRVFTTPIKYGSQILPPPCINEAARKPGQGEVHALYKQWMNSKKGECMRLTRKPVWERIAFKVEEQVTSDSDRIAATTQVLAELENERGEMGLKQYGDILKRRVAWEQSDTRSMLG